MSLLLLREHVAFAVAGGTRILQFCSYFGNNTPFQGAILQKCSYFAALELIRMVCRGNKCTFAFWPELKEIPSLLNCRFA
ncbi:hypothetical protein D3C75_984630 [compost metagenome]